MITHIFGYFNISRNHLDNSSIEKDPWLIDWLIDWWWISVECDRMEEDGDDDGEKDNRDDDDDYDNDNYNNNNNNDEKDEELH